VKVYVNRQPVSGPWGGGNKTVVALSQALRSSGHDVVYNLHHRDIDLLFCFDPRPNDLGENYGDMWNYKLKHGVPIVQRVGDVGTHGKPWLTDLVKASSEVSDMLIFPSLWAMEKIRFSGNNYKIIHNAPLKEFYENRSGKKPDSKIGIITHHWSTSPKKGFDFYRELDSRLPDMENLEFTYVGRLPSGFEFKNSKYIKAMGDNKKLSEIISSNDVYLTASEEEAGANHVLESLACGLPVAYHENGGSIVEYCSEYGEQYSDVDSMFMAIDRIISNYLTLRSKVLCYQNNITNVVSEYTELICDMV
tara:strand:- start:49 stop:966 length:918 start_codon:yes stop_codon:yes gene_type:complete